MTAADILALLLAVLFLAAAVAHLRVPAYFRSLVPPWVPRPAVVVQVSGAVDAVVGVLLLVPATRPWGGLSAAGAVAAYLVAHLDAARTARTASRWLDRPVAVALRIATNVAYVGAGLCIWWAGAG